MAKAKKKASKKPRATAGDDKFRKLIVIGDDGKFYALERSQWMIADNLVKEAATQSSVQVLKDAGTYLAFVSPKLSVGAGMACTVVNLGAILKNAGLKKTR